MTTEQLKELLSEVLGEEVDWIEPSNSKMLRYTCAIDDIGHKNTINIHELAHKVKEWAKTHNFIMFSGLRIKSTPSCEVYYRWATEDEENIFKAETEPEAIFKAGQWILENK